MVQLCSITKLKSKLNYSQKAAKQQIGEEICSETPALLIIGLIEVTTFDISSRI